MKLLVVQQCRLTRSKETVNWESAQFSNFPDLARHSAFFLLILTTRMQSQIYKKQLRFTRRTQPAAPLRTLTWVRATISSVRAVLWQIFTQMLYFIWFLLADKTGKMLDTLFWIAYVSHCFLQYSVCILNNACNVCMNTWMTCIILLHQMCRKKHRACNSVSHNAMHLT